VSSPAVRAFAPGRVNLIGEHTDYNDGLCLPFAIGLGVTVEVRDGGGDEISAEALDLGEEDRFELGDPTPADGWRAFVRGVSAELARDGHDVRPAHLAIRGDLPRGAGLSSSAALAVALALALVAHGGGPAPDRLELARLCSRVENEWVGARTGLLDQLASLFGREGCALLLDLRELSVDPVPLRLGEWRLVVAHSGVEHAHGESGYNQRREECRAACAALGVRSLREARREDLTGLPGQLERRARHVHEENARVEAAVRALEDDDLRALGRLLDGSHDSLRDLYEVSVDAVEETRERLVRAGAAGARMVGGGFGGSVLALFPPGRPPPPEAVEVRPSPGARLLACG
jgi:galactokinase